MERDLSIIVANLTQSTADGQVSRPGLLKSLSGAQLGQYFKPYGCWCNFDENRHLVKEGKGAPLDKWDANCKALRDGYSCIMHDLEDACLD